MDTNWLSISDVCSAINDRSAQELAQMRAIRQEKELLKQQLKQTPSSPGVVPSGPRKQGEGCDDEDQGILAAEETPTGGARLKVTLLAAGFLIGPGGGSVRAVSQTTGAEIRSWSETFVFNGKSRRVRTIVVEGPQPSIIAALAILSEAVERYKLFCEGQFCGKFVDRVQTIRGVDFFYSPPPRSAVPYAAALKNELPATSSGNSNPTSGLSKLPGMIPGGYISPTSAVQKENAMPVLPKAANTEKRQGLASLTQAQINAAHRTAASPSPLTTSVNLDGNGMYFGDTSAAIYHQDGALAAAMASAKAYSLLNPEFGYQLQQFQDFPAPDLSHLQTYNSSAGAPLIQDRGQFTVPVAEAMMFASPLNKPGAAANVNNTHLIPGQLTINSMQQHQQNPTTQYYSLFGPDNNVFGPHLIRDLWNYPAPMEEAHPSFRGIPPVSVRDAELNKIGIPSYEDFAGKYSFFTPSSAPNDYDTSRSNARPPTPVDNAQ